MTKNLKNKRVILTGATGGIGSEIAKSLLIHGCKIGLVDLSNEALEKLVKELNQPDQINLIQADITNFDDQQKIITEMGSKFGGIDILINSAGLMDFTSLLEQSNERINAMFQVNVIAPIQLAKAVIPFMLEQKSGHIVNIGSTFGSIGFAWFSTYSSSKFGLRGFSQALRRELAETPIKVSYIAPRAVKTTLNSDAVYEMAKEVKMNMDEPQKIAKNIIKAIIKQNPEKYFGFPESLFVRINAIFPSLVDKGTRQQNKIAQKYLK